jgi:hypothetical protein
LKEDISLLRRAAESGIEVSDEIAILRAELAYTKTIFYDFVRDTVARDCPLGERRVGQQTQTEERGILQVIDNRPRQHFMEQNQLDRLAAEHDEQAQNEQNENIPPPVNQRNGHPNRN